MVLTQAITDRSTLYFEHYSLTQPSCGRFSTSSRQCFLKAALKQIVFLDQAQLLECFPLGDRSGMSGNREGKECQLCCVNLRVAPLCRLAHTAHVSRPCNKAPIPHFLNPRSLSSHAQQEVRLSASVLTKVLSQGPRLFCSGLPLSFVCVLWGGRRSVEETEGWRPDRRAVKMRECPFMHLSHPSWGGPGQCKNANLHIFVEYFIVFLRALLYQIWSL